MAIQHDADGVAQLSDIMRAGSSAPDPEPVDPAVRRTRRRRGRIAAGVAALVLVGSLGGYVTWALTAPLPAPEGGALVAAPASGPAAALTPTVDGVASVDVAGGEQYLGPDGLRISTGDDGPRPIASITKLVTVMTILDAHPLAGVDDPGPTLTFSRADHALYDKYYVMGATIAAMPTGSTMSLRDALEMMLVISACNYAEAVSTWAFGSPSAFLSAADAWLEAHGLANTTIVEPTGIDGGNVSSPSDLLALGELAMADPVVAQIVGMPAIDVPGQEPRSATNTLLGELGVDGIKTGTLDTSNLLFSARLDVGIEEPLRVTGVVLGGFSRDSVNRDVRVMLEAIVAGFHEVPLADAGAEAGGYTTVWGEDVRLVFGDGAELLTWSDTPITVRVSELELGTGDAGEQVGTVTWTAGSREVSVPLVLESAIRPPDQWWRLTHPAELAG